MEALKETRKMNTLTFRVPAGVQTTFLKTMAKNMGWEAHILPDWLIIYEISDRIRLVRLVRTGTHSDLF